MSQLKTYFFVKCLTLWVYIKEFFLSLYFRFKNFSEYFSAYFQNKHVTWLIIPYHTLPMCLANVSNKITSSWIYYSHYNTLFYNGSIEMDDYIETTNKFSWLSVKIVIITPTDDGEFRAEYDIDPFLNQFRICTIGTECPSLHTIFLAWCIYTKQWFHMLDKVQFHIIDYMGEERILLVEGHNYCLTIRDNKIYDIVNQTHSLE